MTTNTATKSTTRLQRYYDALAVVLGDNKPLVYSDGERTPGTPIDEAIIDDFDRNPESSMMLVTIDQYRDLQKLLGARCTFATLSAVDAPASIDAIVMQGFCGRNYVLVGVK